MFSVFFNFMGVGVTFAVCCNYVYSGLMRIDQNGPTKRTDLGCDDLPPIEAQQLNRFLLRTFDGCYERSLDVMMDIISVRRAAIGRRLNFDQYTPTRLGLSFANG